MPQLELLSRAELASRLVLTVADGYVEPQQIAAQNIKVWDKICCISEAYVVIFVCGILGAGHDN